jgi:hypothetical protein
VNKTDSKENIVKHGISDGYQLFEGKLKLNRCKGNT